jgi:hypothetical protein
MLVFTVFRRKNDEFRPSKIWKIGYSRNLEICSVPDSTPQSLPPKNHIMEKTFTIGDRTFVLDQDKAEEAYAAKRIINGRKTEAFNLLPLKYQWAYELYRTMKANHWEPEDIQMQKDIEQWQGDELSDSERWIIRMGSGISQPLRESWVTTSSTSSANL